MKRLFGTDGIRAVAGESPLDPPTVRIFGAALADVLATARSRPARVVLGRDTRQSGPWLRDAVAAGLTSRGSEAIDAGVITTPGLAYAVRTGDFDAGVMISASHNPYQDNGLKTFGPTGFKLSDELEEKIEIQMLDRGMTDPGEGPAVPSDDGLLGQYVALLDHALPDHNRFQGTHLILDCANGAASDIAPDLFRRYGAKIESLGTSPDGKNINLECGSLHLDKLAATVRQRGCDMGLAFDGDADRCLAVDSRGRVIDGDHILFIVGRNLKRRGELPGDGLVATIMSNYWLQDRLGAEGITLHRASVGDKYVLEKMLDEDLVLGGEQSGHVIFREFATTGDGILTGLLLLNMLIDESESLETIVDGIVPYPQVLLNVRVTDKPDLRKHSEIGPVVREIEQELNDSGRVVLRYSGTEPLTRVMVEGKDAVRVREHAERLAGVIRETIGV